METELPTVVDTLEALEVLWAIMGPPSYMLELPPRQWSRFSLQLASMVEWGHPVAKLPRWPKTLTVLRLTGQGPLV